GPRERRVGPLNGRRWLFAREIPLFGLIPLEDGMANLSITGSRTPPVLLDPARLLLRLTLGALILVHGISKIQGGPGFILDIVDKAGLPSPFGYLVYVGEVIAPIL